MCRACHRAGTAGVRPAKRPGAGSPSGGPPARPCWAARAACEAGRLDPVLKLGIPAGAFYLAILTLLAVLGGILSRGLISDWGLVYPRWLPLLGGRRVPPWFPLTPTVLGSGLLVAYSLTLPVQFPRAIADASPADPFTLTGALIGLPILLAWTVALPTAGWSYYRRTRRARPQSSNSI